MAMHDLRSAPHNTILRADVVIVGGGPAGLSIARELANTKLKVLVVDSGGLEYEPEIQSLNAVENVGEPVQGFCQVAGTLGDKLGALLFQLPPNLKKDLALFDAFLEALPPKVCAAFEFRHASWHDEEIFARLPQ